MRGSDAVMDRNVVTRDAIPELQRPVVAELKAITANTGGGGEATEADGVSTCTGPEVTAPITHRKAPSVTGDAQIVTFFSCVYLRPGGTC